MTSRHRWRWRGALLLAALPTGLGGLLYLEVAIARRGPAPTNVDVGLLPGRVGAEGPAQRVVWLGDSTAAGVGAVSPEGALPRLVAGLQRRPTELRVLARSGAQIRHVLDRQLPKVASLEPELILISVGANDVTHLTSPGDFAASYRLLVGQLPVTARIVVLGVPDLGAPPRLLQPLRAVAGWRGRQLEGALRRLADELGLEYVDIAGQTGPLFRSDPGRYFSPDGYHPNGAGYGLWADEVLKVLEPEG
ncbi:MAG: SGNH/GDSL hydrolase family protein [Acidimicrobiia bacterium]